MTDGSDAASGQASDAASSEASDAADAAADDGAAAAERSLARGMWAAVGAYTAWGVFPIYWKLLGHVPIMQVISHRIVWSSVILLAWIAVWRQSTAFRTSLAAPGVFRTYAIGALLIGVNWIGFVWAVGAGYIVETSLGYFINPLLSVLLGVLVLGERLRPMQAAAVALAAAGVAWITFVYGELPWISLFLATTFALYGLVKKRAPLGSVHGLALETGLLVAPAFAFLVWCEWAGQGVLGHSDGRTTAMLVGAGVVTTIPLLLFASAARRIPLLWIGLFQYIAPSIQLAVGVLLYEEPFPRERFIGFAVVWAALAVFAIDGLRASHGARRERRQREQRPPGAMPPPE